MYCSSCGSALLPNLTYCNRCGARVNSPNADDPKSQLSPELLVCAMVGLFVLGTGVIIGLIATMREVAHFDLGFTMFVTGLMFTVMLVMEGILISLLLRRMRPAAKDQTAHLKEHTTKELEAGSPLGLPEPVASVTEHTTRAFEKVFVERK